MNQKLEIPTDESRLAQNRNGLDYCSTCEQSWDYCSCATRNTGFNSCREQVKKALENL